MAGQLIVLFCSSFPPEGGGASARMYNLAVLLRDAGYRVQVVCAMPNYPTGKIFPAYRGRKVVDEVVDGIPVKRVWLIPSNAGNPLKRALSAASLVWGMRRYAYRRIKMMQPSLVIVSSPPLPMAADTVRHFSKQGRKVLLNVSDLWPQSASGLGALHESSILYKMLRRMERHMYDAATAFTAQSDESIAHIRRFAGSEKLAMVYRNLPTGLPQKPHPIPPGDAIRIIYPGMLGHAQGLLALCKAIPFAALNAELHIYGEGPEQEALKEWLSSNSDCGVCCFAPLSVAELSALLPQYHAMLVPLAAPLEGALPSKIFTAIWSGIPIIYSGSGEGARMVQEYELGWNAAPLDYKGIATLIRALAQCSAEELTAKQAHILEIGRTVFSKAAQDKAMLQIISGILE